MTLDPLALFACPICFCNACVALHRQPLCLGKVAQTAGQRPRTYSLTKSLGVPAELLLISFVVKHAASPTEI